MQAEIARANTISNSQYSQTIQSLVQGDNYIIVRMRVTIQTRQRDAIGFATFNNVQEMETAIEIAHTKAFTKALNSFEANVPTTHITTPSYPQTIIETPVQPATHMQVQTEEKVQVLCHCKRRMIGVDRNGNLFKQCHLCHQEELNRMGRS